MTSATYIEVFRLREDRGTRIYRAVRASDRRAILLRALAPGAAAAEDVARLVNELEIGKTAARARTQECPRGPMCGSR